MGYKSADTAALRGGFVRGTEQVIKNMNAALSKIENLSAEGMQEGLNITVKKSKEYCPVDTGTLKNSHKTKVKKLKTKIHGIITVDATIAQRMKAKQLLKPDTDVLFGNATGKAPNISTAAKSTSYALLVHETHKTHSKFLEKAAYETQNEVLKKIQDSAKKATI